MSLSGYSRYFFSALYSLDPLAYSTVSVADILKFAFMMIFLGSFGLALLSSMFDVLILKKLLINTSPKIALSIGIPAQALMIILIVHILDFVYYYTLPWIYYGPVSPNELTENMFLIVHLIVAVSISKVFIEIDRKLGPGNLWKMLSGKFIKPREEERIFMFIDLKSSTSFAEKIGHLEYSRFLQNCYQDFSIVDRYRADIYQYVGDEVVVSWNPKKGTDNDNFLKAFFAFTDLLKKKTDYYQKEYGITPYFKAGANIGPVIITEVGDIKREITYHGDTLNTAARIQEKCNELNAPLLISEPLFKLIKNKAAYKIDDVGTIHLKGKGKDVRLYRVAQLNS